jgi:hypothetical protein
MFNVILRHIAIPHCETRTKLLGFSPQANYTDRATAVSHPLLIYVISIHERSISDLSVIEPSFIICTGFLYRNFTNFIIKIAKFDEIG